MLWLCGCLLLAIPAAAQEGVTIPELDVADSVRRMLEAGRGQGQGATVEEAAPEGTVAAPVPAAAPPAPVAESAPVPPAAAVPAPVPDRTAPAAAGTGAGHVPVPVREITIRSVDDIRALARELEEAKRRQQR